LTLHALPQSQRFAADRRGSALQVIEERGNLLLGGHRSFRFRNAGKRWRDCEPCRGCGVENQLPQAIDIRLDFDEPKSIKSSARLVREVR
jgi:hypothetical protein